MRGPTWNFIRHLLEMTVAMVVGMFVFGMPATMLFEGLGWTAMDAVVPETLVMATTMSLGMAIWMRVRGCGWPAILEMSLAMYVAFLVMYPFYWAGIADGMAVMVIGHVLMVPAMVVAMLFRLPEYTGSHKHHARPAEQEHKELAAQPEG